MNFVASQEREWTGWVNDEKRRGKITLWPEKYHDVFKLCYVQWLQNI